MFNPNELFINGFSLFIDVAELFFFSAVSIKKNKANTKFKLRCSRYLYTFVIEDNEKAEKLRHSLPPGKMPSRILSKFIINLSAFLNALRCSLLSCVKMILENKIAVAFLKV